MAKLTEIYCADCSVEFHVLVALIDRRRKDGKNFYCPNGHANHYGDCEHDRTCRENERLKQQQARLADETAYVRQRAEHAERSAAAYKGQATKLRKRAKAGVCPCCNRQFKDLHSHMKTKHPGFAGDQPELKIVDGGKAS